MRALVTGGAGFIGSHVVDGLLAANHEVLVIDDLSTGRAANLDSTARLEEIGLGSPALEGVVGTFDPEVVFHLAAQVNVRASVSDPLHDAEVNVLGTIALIQACRAAKTLVFSSTGGAIYGEQDVFPAAEDHALRPVSPYGASKLCAESYLGYFARSSPMRVVCLRYANVYGPRQDPLGEAGVVAIFCGLMLNDEAPTINGDGTQTRDYVYVGDVARANMLALDSRADGAFNIGTGVETEVNTLAKELARATKYTGDLRHGQAMPGEQMRSVLAADRARRELRWSPEVSLAEGIEHTVQWFRQQQPRRAAETSS